MFKAEPFLGVFLSEPLPLLKSSNFAAPAGLKGALYSGRLLFGRLRFLGASAGDAIAEKRFSSSSKLFSIRSWFSPDGRKLKSSGIYLLYRYPFRKTFADCDICSNPYNNAVGLPASIVSYYCIVSCNLSLLV